MSYLVYSRPSETFPEHDLPGGLTYSVWRPTSGHPVPPTMGGMFILWWLFHAARIFRNRDYAILFIMDGRRFVHRSCLVPPYFRWPFMAPRDLQVSSTWTDPEYRGRGLATAALKQALRLWAMPGRTFWYVTREDNAPSIGVCRRAGFDLQAHAERTYFLGSRLLGSLRPLDREKSARSWYEDYYGRLGADRNDLRVNSGVLFQTLAMYSAVVRAMRTYPLPVASSRLLDVGCGNASNLYHLVLLGFKPQNVCGIDIIPERIDEARLLYPQAHWVNGDAAQMVFRDGEFDLVFEYTMFATLTDEPLCARIAREMLRVCKPDGYLMLVDWRTPKPTDDKYRALTRSRLDALFLVGSETELVGVYRGALVPPIGRALSTYLPSLYFLVAAMCPILVGQVVYVLRKRRGAAAINSKM